MGMEYNWASFKKRIDIDAPIERVYQMWATRNGMEKWFLRQCAYHGLDGALLTGDALVSEGDGFDWLWHGWPDNEAHKGKILSANGNDSLSFTFGHQAAPDMVCAVRIYTEQNTTICELVQNNIPVDDKNKSAYHLGCSLGWAFYMTNLKSILEGGIDLRNKNVDLKGVLNA